MKGYIFLLFTICLCLSTNTVQGQRTAADWIRAAERAEARGDHANAGACRSSAASLQAETGQYEAAADNYRRAGEHFEKDGRPAQSDAEHTNAATAYERAAEVESHKGNHRKAAELFEKAAEQYQKAGYNAMAEAARRKAEAERQLISFAPADDAIRFTARGTGQTTGHIATVSIENPTGQSYSFPAGHYYIPSHNDFQSFAGQVETSVTVPAGGTATVPVFGDCTNIFQRPPGHNENTASVNNWKHVSEQAPTDPRHPFQTVAPIDENWRPYPSNGWQTVPPQTDLLTLTIPGTSVPLNAILEPGSSPAEEARYYVGIANLVRESVYHLQETGQLPPVLSRNPDLNAQGIIQQVIWMVSAAAIGQTYTEEGLYEIIARQYEQMTGIPLAEESPTVQEDMKNKAGTAWESFLFVGLEAKVISADNQPGPVFQNNDEEEIEDCALTRAGMTVQVRIQRGSDRRNPAVDTTFRETVREAADDGEIDIFIGDNRLIRRGDTVSITITSPFIECDCEEDDCEPLEMIHLEGPRGADDEVNHIGDASSEDDFNEANRDEDGATFGGRGGAWLYYTRFITSGRIGGYQGRTVYPGIKFRLRTTCISGDCGSAEVIQKFQVKIR